MERDKKQQTPDPDMLCRQTKINDFSRQAKVTAALMKLQNELNQQGNPEIKVSTFTERVRELTGLFDLTPDYVEEAVDLFNATHILVEQNQELDSCTLH